MGAELAQEFADLVGQFNHRTELICGHGSNPQTPEQVVRVVELQTKTLVHLRDLRARVLLSERATQDAARSASARAGNKNHFVLGALGVSPGKVRASEKRAIAGRKGEIVADYRVLKGQIDDIIRQITTGKAALKAEQATQRELAKLSRATKRTDEVRPGLNEPVAGFVAELQSVAQASRALVAPMPPPAGWHADPYRRHEHRYWDGAVWTAHVSDRGVQSQDVV
jgi:Protein of unknown function (DUF2510)